MSNKVLRKLTNVFAFAGIGSFLLLATALLTPASPQKTKTKPNAPSVAKLQYNRDIRPILAENCFACHGPDSAARKANLRIDRPGDAYAVRDGRIPIAKGKPDNSEVFKRLIGKGPIMPPVSTHKKLTPVQIATVKRWIAEGAEYQPHWSYIAPKRPALPTVKNTKWVRNTIDTFILAKIEAAGLTPAPEADRRTLARRLSLDLTGLPPAPADVENFVNDKSPNAYEKLVDKFMAMPQWGEHRGRFWLDAARYADTHGIHFDNYREMWSYRDWVIKAFNDNMRYDRFTIEQLAGDLLPNPSLSQRVATGFNRNNITTNEGGVIPEEYNVLYTRDRTETVSQIWLGTTANCAVCHDHKFDPLSQREFYQMAAFFNNTTQNPMDGNIKDTPPIIPVPKEEDQDRFAAIAGQIDEAQKQVEARKANSRDDFNKALAGGSFTSIHADIGAEALVFQAPLNEGKGKEITVLNNGQKKTYTTPGNAVWEAGYVYEKAFKSRGNSSFVLPEIGDIEKNQPFSVSVWVKLPRNDTGGAIIARMDEPADYRGWDIWVEGNRVGTHIVNKWPDNALKVVTNDPLEAGRWHHVAVTYDGSMKAAGVKVYVDGTLKSLSVTADGLNGTIRTNVPLKIGQRNTSAVIENLGIHDLRLYHRVLSDDEAGRIGRNARVAWLLAQKQGNLKANEREELFTWWLNGQDPTYRDARSKLKGLENERQMILSRGTIAHVSQEKTAEAMAYILHRGEYDKRRDQVKPATPSIMPPMPADLPKNRLGFAKWLLMPQHPLTTRVTVNRFWQEVFGQGLVRTAGDFGISGELPSHPELLDWMALEFRAMDWDIKKFFKLLVTSATYRQSNIITPEKKLKDPSNKLYARGTRFRMDAEMIRDYALASSGLLVRKLGGPSVKPYQPDGVWEAVAMIGSNTRDYRRDSGENLYRRSMYTFWKRSAPPASMEILNAPNRETCVVRRERTNTPMQAMVTLNDVQFVEAARALAERTLKEGGKTANSRIDYMARRLLARPLTPKELPIVTKSIGDLEKYYSTRAEDAKLLIRQGESKPDSNLPAESLAAWTMLANQLLNLDEVLNK